MSYREKLQMFASRRISFVYIKYLLVSFEFVLCLNYNEF